GRRFAITCDKAIGVREIVVKSMGPLLAPLSLYAGATISGAGKVQLILDAAVLAKMAYPAAEAPAHEDSGAGIVPAPAEVPRILVADDSRAVREAIVRMLASEGYVVDAAVDGAEAWAMLGEVRYDLLVTDVDMPRLAGPELLAKARERFPLLRVMVISSRAG